MLQEARPSRENCLLSKEINKKLLCVKKNMGRWIFIEPKKDGQLIPMTVLWREIR